MLDYTRKEDLEHYEDKMFGSPPTIPINEYELSKGNMQKYLQSKISYLNKYSIGHFKIEDWQELRKDDFNFNNLKAKLYQHDFTGFSSHPSATVKFYSNKRASVERYIDMRSKEGIGTLREFYMESWEGRKYSYMHDIDFRKELSATKFKWDLSTENGLQPGFRGISTPYFYIGSKYSMFPLHLEDVNLRSINVHLGGAPKIWYSISSDQIDLAAEKLSELVQSPCEAFYRHKEHYFNLAYLHQNGIMIDKVIQYPGEIVVTSSFHQGINLGLNYNVAVNILLEPGEIGKNFNLARQCGPNCDKPIKSLLLPSLQDLGKGLICDYIVDGKICGKKYTSANGLIKHNKIKHSRFFPKRAKKGKCPVCGKKLAQPEIHMARKHPNHIPREFCGMCRVTFTPPDTLQKHWKKKHPKTNQKCPNCGEIVDKMKECRKHVCNGNK